MALNRRNFMHGAGALATGAALSPLMPKAGFAASTLEIGEFRLDTVSDGLLNLPGDFSFAPMPQDELKPILAQYGISRDRVSRPCNVTLLRDGERTILFDVGSGPDFVPTAGELVDTLDALGVAPEDVTHVVFTHAHPDHLWGLLDDFDEPLFYEAEHMIGQAEWDYWTNPNTVDDIGEARAAFAVGAKRRLDVIAETVTLFNDGQEILPGVAARATYGHTPGHMAFELRSGSNSAMIVGDSISNHHVSFVKPQWPTGSDEDPETAIKTRLLLLDQLASEQMPLIGFHLPEGGVGRAERKDGAFVFTSEV